MELTEKMSAECGWRHVEECIKCIAYVMLVQPTALWRGAHASLGSSASATSALSATSAAEVDLKDSALLAHSFSTLLRFVAHPHPKAFIYFSFIW